MMFSIIIWRTCEVWMSSHALAKCNQHQIMLYVCLCKDNYIKCADSTTSLELPGSTSNLFLLLCVIYCL